MVSTSFVIGLGSNRPHGRYGRPATILVAALDAMRAAGLRIEQVSRTRKTPALGPSLRDFANAAALVESRLEPPAMLALLKRIERDFGRRRGQRWGARVLDLDILVWSQGDWRQADLLIPHPELHRRAFALGPAAEIAPDWHHPRLGFTLRQLEHRHARRRAVDRAPHGQ